MPKGGRPTNPKELNEAFGTWIKAKRRAKNITQAQLVEAMPISSVSLSNIERGTYSCSLKHMLSYYETLGISIDEFLEMQIKK